MGTNLLLKSIRIKRANKATERFNSLMKENLENGKLKNLMKVFILNLKGCSLMVFQFTIICKK